MRGLLIFFGLAVVSVSGWFDPGLRVKFSIGLQVGKDFFFDVPRTVTRAVLEGWTRTDRPFNVPRSSLELYCPSDLAVCGLYDDNGFIAGLQVALLEEDFQDAIYDWRTQGFVEWIPAIPSGEMKKYWVIQQYYVSEQYLSTDPNERLRNYNPNRFLQEESVWLTGFHGVIDQIPYYGSEIENSIFTRQECIPWMGRHFYYNMTQSTPCRADTLYPWFPLVHSGELVGTGLIIYGKYPIKPDQRDWFERPPTLAVQLIVPRGPDCLYELTLNPGIITMHIYFINQPWTMDCMMS